MPLLRPLLPALALATVALAACTSKPVAPPAPAAAGNAQLELTLASGTYRCEGGFRLQVNREFRDRTNHRLHLVWNGSNYQLDRNPSFSGLPRFEDPTSGLVWIDMPAKSLLLDGSSGTPLANECRPA